MKSVRLDCYNVVTYLCVCDVIESSHSRDQQPCNCKFIGKKESLSMRKELNSHKIGLVTVQQHGRRFTVLDHQHACCDVACERALALRRSLRWTCPHFPNFARQDIVI